MSKSYSEDLRERALKVVDKKWLWARCSKLIEKQYIDEGKETRNIKPSSGYQKAHSLKIKDLFWNHTQFYLM